MSYVGLQGALRALSMVEHCEVHESEENAHVVLSVSLTRWASLEGATSAVYAAVEAICPAGIRVTAQIADHSHSVILDTIEYPKPRGTYIHGTLDLDADLVETVQRKVKEKWG